ncbi:MAG: hypothetical protein M3Z33_05355 [Actinomycetota bacterium]|nr:hypothetical protein [Actinomycetota bacterium]
MRRYSVPVVAVLAASLAVSACGSSSKSKNSSSKPTQLPRADFVQKADAICTAGNKRLMAAGPSPKFNPATATKAQLASSTKFFKALSQEISSDVSGVSALGEPSEAAPKQAWHELRASLQNTSVPNSQKLISDARTGDLSAFRADFKTFSSTDSIQTKDGKIIGFKVCGQG